MRAKFGRYVWSSHSTMLTMLVRHFPPPAPPSSSLKFQRCWGDRPSLFAAWLPNIHLCRQTSWCLKGGHTPSWTRPGSKWPLSPALPPLRGYLQQLNPPPPFGGPLSSAFVLSASLLIAPEEEGGRERERGNSFTIHTMFITNSPFTTP